MTNSYTKETSNDDNLLEEKVKKTNIMAMSTISFFMNFASGMIVSSATNFLIGQLNCSQSFLGIVRGGAEGMGNLFKIIFGMLSDYMKNRKLFLMIGYGGMFFLKPMFGLAAIDFFSRSVRIFLYGFTHAIDRVLNGMRDGVRDASIYESSGKTCVGRSLGLRKLMACLGSTFGGIFSFFMLRKFGDFPHPSLFAKMYFSTIIPVIISMFILIFFVKDLFKEKHKHDKKDIFITDYQSENNLLGSTNKISLFSWILGFGGVFGSILIFKIFHGCCSSSMLWYMVGILVSLMIILLSRCGFNYNISNSFCSSILSIMAVVFNGAFCLILKYIGWNSLASLQSLVQFYSLVSIGTLILEIFLVKIYPQFFHKNSQRREALKVFNLVNLFLLGCSMSQVLLTLLSNSGAMTLKEIIVDTFFKYGINGTVIVPFIMMFKWLFYKLYLAMQNTLEFYSPQLKKYDKMIILNFILAFSKYSDIFLFKHIIDCCHWDPKYSPLLFAFLYLIFGIFSYVLGKLSDGFFKKYSLWILVFINLSFNIISGYLSWFPMTLKYILGITSLLFYGIYVGFVDCVLVSLVSKSIPANHLLATLLGLFYLLIGVGNTCASYLFGTVFGTAEMAYRYAIIPGALGLLYFLWNRKILTKDEV
jgi:MFS family permease